MERVEEDYHFDKAINILLKINENLQQIKVEDLNGFCNQFILLFKKLGNLMDKAFKDINQKIQITQKNALQLKKEYVFETVEYEIELEIQGLNSFNNKELNKEKQYERYESSTRTFLRMMWFIDFIFYYMSMFHDEPKAKSSKIARHAYSKALAHNHDTIIQMAAKVAFSFVPNRHEFSIKFLSDPNYDPQNAIQQVAFLLDLLQPFRNVLWNFYHSKQLNKANLP